MIDLHRQISSFLLLLYYLDALTLLHQIVVYESYFLA